MRITKLDGLRGIFSLLIVPIHYGKEYLPDYISGNFIISESYTFVDFFFVLSGFVIAYNYNGLTTISEFWIYMKKRLARLYPLLFFTTTLMLLYRLFRNFINTYFSSLYTFTNEGGSSLTELLHKYLDTILMTNSNPILGTGLGLNTPTWSISAEMISYLVFGLVSVYAIGKRKKILLLLIILFSVLFCIYKGELFMTSNFGFVRGLISFNLGYFVYLMSKTKINLNAKLEYLIPLLLGVLFYFLNSYPAFSVAKNMFGLITIPLFFSMCILLLLNTDGFLSKFLDTKSMQFLGKVSYSIYLNHYLLVAIIPMVLFQLLKIPQNDFTQIFVLVFSLIAIVFYSKYTYQFIEINLGKKFRKLLFKNS